MPLINVIISIKELFLQWKNNARTIKTEILSDILSRIFGLRWNSKINQMINISHAMRFTFFSFRALCYPETGITLPPVNGVQKLASNHN